MKISSADKAAPQAPPAISMTKKALDQQKEDGKAAVKLIQSAEPPPKKPGQSLSIYA